MVAAIIHDLTNKPGTIRESSQKKAQERHNSWAFQVIRRFSSLSPRSGPKPRCGIPR